MSRSVPFEQIVKPQAERASVQGDWSRQRATAHAIAARFDDDYDAVLLADEVGMGKTYVALAVMADYLMQSEGNDRKVLLITPPSHVLKHKWIEEIASFNGKYVNGHASGARRKDMRPLNVNIYWELFRNLHDYQDSARLRVDDSTLHPFLYTLFGWAKSRGLLGKQPRLWPIVNAFDVLGKANLRFTARYSQAAIREFLDSEHAAYEDWFREQFRQLKVLGGPTWQLANLFKRFAGQQDRFEPNVYVMNMSALGAPRIHEAENRLFSEFVLGFLLTRLRAANTMSIVRALEDANILRQHERYARWDEYLKTVLQASCEDMYGLRGATQRVLQRTDVSGNWRALRSQLQAGGAHGVAAEARRFFNEVRNLVFQEKLAEANIGLAVIDEVHNWKGGKHNAEIFKTQYAPAIPNKLIMSATPFQVEEGEMERVFNYVVREDGRATEVLGRVFDKKAGLMRACLDASNKFAVAWQALSTVANSPALLALLEAQDTGRIRTIAHEIVSGGSADETVENFASALLAYRETIEKLQATLRRVVVRHTKPRDKRDFRIGEHFHAGHPDGRPRPTLYPSNGYAGEDAAMVNFIGMRLGQLAERETGKTGKANARLLGGMSSSTAAYLHGASARRSNSSHQRYQAMFAEVLKNTVHPKVEATVARAFDNFVKGRKTLIFCERIHTLDEIESLLTKRIDAHHQTQQRGQDAMQRKSLLKRADLVDNLWWISLGDAAGQSDAFTTELGNHRNAAGRFVQTCLTQAGIKPGARRIIRLLDVYLLAQTAALNAHVADAWPHAMHMFTGLYGALTAGDSETRTRLLHAYVNGSGQTEDERSGSANDNDEDEGTAEVERVLAAQYGERQNLWCAEPRVAFHRALWDLLDAEAARLLNGKHDAPPLQAFAEIVLQLMVGLRRVALREDLIARYEAAGEYKTHFERISAGIASMDVGHGETMLARIQRFIEGLAAEEGSINQADQRDSKRRSMWSGILRQDVKHVSTLSGAVGNDLRAKLCASFNSPLLPDILVCSAIGSEGIDLHRHCADIIHHDLPWNPAKLEQRIGRLDRVNSLADPAKGTRIHIGIPFLANNYEKYQYDVVFSRAQKFEVLLGTPDFNASDIDEEVYEDGAGAVRESEDADAIPTGGGMPPLPEPIIQFLKVDLAVARQGNATEHKVAGNPIVVGKPAASAEALEISQVVGSTPPPDAPPLLPAQDTACERIVASALQEEA
jgi:hypothetical protein